MKELQVLDFDHLKTDEYAPYSSIRHPFRHTSRHEVEIFGPTAEMFGQLAPAVAIHATLWFARFHFEGASVFIHSALT